MRSAAYLICLLAVSCGGKAEDPPEPSPQPIVKSAAGVEMVRIPAGSFEMGSASGEEDERPVHRVSIDSFLMDRREVTQEQFQKLGRPNPSHFKGPTLPVEMIPYAQAALFCNLRSRAEGLEPCYNEDTAECNFEANGYRLPTEAEWEYACRAGSTAEYSFGNERRRLGEYGWFAENSQKKTHPVGTKKPNPWGLFDMHGGVAEWCNDVYDKDSYRTSPASNPRGAKEGDKYVYRGGSWNSGASSLRSSARASERGFGDACFSSDSLGIRCVRKAGVSTGASALPQSPPTALLTGDLYLEHNTGEGFPERPARLKAIVDRLKEKGLLAKLVVLEPTPAPLEWITAIHDPAYVERVRKICEGAGQGVVTVDSGDVPVGKRSYEVALAAAGGVLRAVDAVMEGKARNAFCPIRPPGHHALKDRAMGFCLFNNAAIAARYIQKKHKLEKVLIIDWDVHHGNGTQDLFYEDGSVLYFSTHQHPFYPRTGKEDEKGAGKGQGLMVNVPLPRGAGDAEVRKAYEEKLKPAADAFKPDFVLISCGFDSHVNDTLGQLAITTEGFAWMTRFAKEIAAKHAKGRLVSMLEGGYNLDNLANAGEAHVRALME